MKELTIEQKAEVYDKALKVIKDNLNDLNEIAETGAKIVNIQTIKNCFYRAFPELKESKDERIRKEIIGHFRNIKCVTEEGAERIAKWIAWLEKQKVLTTEENLQGKEDVLWCIKQAKKHAKDENEMGTCWFAEKWLEKQGEQKPADKIEPKFHEGDWVVEPREGEPNGLWHIERIEDNHYWEGNTGVRIEHADKYYHHWTIQDVQDGDVLVCEGKHGQEIGIVKKYVGKYGGCDICFETYCFVDWDGIFRVGEHMGSRNIHPATKEQRDTLMKAMADAGYTFDFEKKELKEIDNEIEIPFGAKDSELQEVTYYIPKGFHAEINDDKVVIKKCEKTSEWSEEDEKILNSLISSLARISALTRTDSTSINYTFSKEIDWLKSLKERYTWKPSDEQRRAICLAAGYIYNLHPEITKILKDMLNELEFV